MFRFNRGQAKQLAEFTSNLCLFFFATALAPLFAEVDKFNNVVITLGLIDGIICLIMSLSFLKGGK